MERALSSVGLEHLVYTEGVGGSNPSAPTSRNIKDGSHWGLSFFYDSVMMVTVYILYSEKADRYYIGQTSELEERLMQHNQGDSSYTKFGIPWKLVYKERCENRSEAMKREKKLKGSKNREYIRRVIHSSRNELNNA